MLRSKTAVDWQCISLLEITILELRNRAFLTNDYDSFNMLTSFKLSWSNTNLLLFRFHNICLLNEHWLSHLQKTSYYLRKKRWKIGYFWFHRSRITHLGITYFVVYPNCIEQNRLILIIKIEAIILMTYFNQYLTLQEQSQSIKLLTQYQWMLYNYKVV